MKQIEFKTFPAEFKVSDSGLIEGYLSTYGNVDEGGDIVEPTAFDKTLKEGLPKGRILLLIDHIWQVDHVGGKLIKGVSDTEGLFTSWMTTSLKRMDDVKTLIKEGIIKSLSMGYQTIVSEVIDGIRHLKEVRLFEGSIVPFPMNVMAVITGIKAWDDWIEFNKQWMKFIELKPWEETDEFISHRVREPNLFKPDTFRTKDIGKGISLIIGKLKSPPEGEEDSMVVQSVRFDKNEGWTLSTAKAWIADHPDIAKSKTEAGPVLPPTYNLRLAQIAYRQTLLKGG